MVDDSYTRDRTALLFVDLHNDFLTDGGKLWPLVEGVAKEVGLLDNLRTITAAIRAAQLVEGRVHQACARTGRNVPLHRLHVNSKGGTQCQPPR